MIAPPLWPLNLTTTRPTPPTLTIETLLVSLCAELKPVEAGCPAGTTVCLSIYNEPGDKGGSDRRLISRIPLAGPSKPTIEGGGHPNRGGYVKAIPKGFFYKAEDVRSHLFVSIILYQILFASQLLVALTMESSRIPSITLLVLPQLQLLVSQRLNLIPQKAS